MFLKRLFREHTDDADFTIINLTLYSVYVLHFKVFTVPVFLRELFTTHSAFIFYLSLPALSQVLC